MPNVIMPNVISTEYSISLDLQHVQLHEFNYFGVQIENIIFPLQPIPTLTKGTFLQIVLQIVFSLNS